MRLGGRIQASIEVLEDIRQQHTPATDALRDWGKSHRFAGSKDRSFIGNLVHDGLRRASSTAWQIDDESPRAIIFGTLAFVWGMSVDDIEDALSDDPHAPSPLTEREITRLHKPIALSDAPDWVRADVPEWLWPTFVNNFGEDAVDEGAALCVRAPLDLRLNPIKTPIDQTAQALKDMGATPCPISTLGYRIRADGPQARLPNIQIEPPFLTGGVEIQDEGSQIVSALMNAQTGDKILDFCAGGGGKSLGLAAYVKNDAKIYAYDIDKRRLAPTYTRAQRAGASCIEVVTPPAENLKHLTGQMDKVLVDAPCTGVGTWRRKPDAKWRLSEESLERRCQEQIKVLVQAAEFVRPGGLLFYVTCSMLAEENEGQIYTFLEGHEAFTLLSAGEVWEELYGVNVPKPWSADGCSLTLTPASTGTDGFFFAVMEKTLKG